MLQCTLLLNTTVLIDNNFSAVFCFLCCVNIRAWLITLTHIGVGGDICSCTGVRARCVCTCVLHVYHMHQCFVWSPVFCVQMCVSPQILVVVNSVCMCACFSYNMHAFSYSLCIWFCVSASISVWQAIDCVHFCVGVCNEQRIQVQRQKHPPWCGGGILAQTGHQMSEQCRNLLSGPVTLFFKF